MRVYMCVSLLHACGFLRNRACVLLHTHLPSMCYFIWEGAAVCVSVCVAILSVSVWGRFVKQPTPEGGEFCLHIDEPALRPLAPEPCTNTAANQGQPCSKPLLTFNMAVHPQGWKKSDSNHKKGRFLLLYFELQEKEKVSTFVINLQWNWGCIFVSVCFYKENYSLPGKWGKKVRKASCW